MEHRQRVEQLVLAAEIDAGRDLRDVGQHVAVRQHDALGQAFRARGEQDHRPVVGLARDQRLLPAQHAAQLVEGADRLADVFQIDDAHLLLRSAATTFSSRPFSTKAREVRMVSTSAARQAPRILAAPAVKLIIAGTRPADITASMVTTRAVRGRQHDAERAAFGRERHQLAAEDRGADQQPLIGQLAADRILDREPVRAVELRRLDQRLDQGAVGRRWCGTSCRT